MTKFTIDGITYHSRFEYFNTIEPKKPEQNYKTYYTNMCKKYIPGFREKCNELTCTILTKRYQEDINFRIKKIKQAQDRYFKNKLISQQLQLAY